MNIHEYEDCLVDPDEVNKEIRYAMIRFATRFLTVAGDHKCRHIDDVFEATNTHIPIPNEFEYRIDALDQFSFLLTMTKDAVKERYKIQGTVIHTPSYNNAMWYSLNKTHWHSQWLGNEKESPI